MTAKIQNLINIIENLDVRARDSKFYLRSLIHEVDELIFELRHPIYDKDRACEELADCMWNYQILCAKLGYKPNSIYKKAELIKEQIGQSFYDPIITANLVRQISISLISLILAQNNDQKLYLKLLISQIAGYFLDICQMLETNKSSVMKFALDKFTDRATRTLTYLKNDPDLDLQQAWMKVKIYDSPCKFYD